MEAKKKAAPIPKKRVPGSLDDTMILTNPSESKKTKATMMMDYNLEVLITMDDARHIDCLFWNPLDVCPLAWDELLKKLSSVAAYEEAVSQKKSEAVFDLVSDEDVVPKKRPSSSAEDDAATKKKGKARASSPVPTSDLEENYFDYDA